MNDDVVALEKELLGAIYACDKVAMRKMMAPDGIGVDATFGFATQQSLIDGIHEASAVAWELSTPRVLEAGKATMVVTYRLRQQVTFKGAPEPSDVYATTVWTRTGGRWQAIFHQETPAVASADSY